MPPLLPPPHLHRAPSRIGADLFLVCLVFATLQSPAHGEISFDKQIRPILSDKCFQCHGPDANARKADLRFDLREGTVADLGGYAAVVPGDPGASELITRITHDDPKEVMPPRKIHKQIKPRELNLLRQWIAEGAEYEQHWSFQPLQKPTVPKVDSPWIKNPIDNFILARLQKENLKPSSPADPKTLRRRLSLDLTGLPPSSIKDQASSIDELLASRQHAEHAAWSWLDAARYADSDGYESDPLRTMWPWRDWVVEAFQRNLPYDQFITEQLAGDLLPNSTLRQKLASGFNRNHRLNNEGGILPEEWIVEYVCDRAETAATVFMGLTWQCSRCHDHKFDPITARDYYQLFAFFNNIEEKGSVSGRNAPPAMDVPALEHFEEYTALLNDIKPHQKELEALANSPDFNKAHAAWLEELKTDEEARKEKLPAALAKIEFKKWTAAHKAQAKEHFLQYTYAPAELQKVFRPLNRRLAELRKTGAKVMIMDELPDPTPAHILERGAYDQPREEVSADTPGFLPPMDAALPKNRLGLAQWLTHPQHPLTARVAVNRLWERFFGTGLVKTQEDFGAQGEPPSHPELLDWLAATFIESGWDLKALQKLIVSSATYQQSSITTPELIAADPDNRLLARGPRYRLSAPVIRDQALAVSGLLVDQPGGPAVKPYQPDGLWREIIKGRVQYEPDTGDKLYRRSLYTLWRRAVKPPSMELLDANLRDTCAVNTKRTNTPLQALLLLNDVTFVEPARQLATRMLLNGGDTNSSRIQHGLQLAVGRPATQQEITLLTTELNNQLKHYRAHPDAAHELITVGESTPNPGLPPVDLAAYTALARILLNLDEILTKS